MTDQDKLIPSKKANIMSGESNGELRNRKGLANYANLWNKDLAQDNDDDTNKRLEGYTDLVNGYYDGATDLYEWGWAQSFHFARSYKGEPFHQSLARHEHYLASMMKLKPGMRVLDVGCGIGGPAREMANFADIKVVGINNNALQVDRATKYTKKAGLSDNVEFVKGNFMELAKTFGEESFDAVYAIEATVHAPSFEGIYGEIKKVLKPNGIFGVYEWVMTDKYDENNTHHREIAKGIEVGDGIAKMQKLEVARDALKAVGFNILHEEDLADRDDPVPWYYMLEGDIRKAQCLADLPLVARTTGPVKAMSHGILKFCEFFKILPPGTYEVGETMKVAQQALVDGGREKLFTPMMLWICQKPE